MIPDSVFGEALAAFQRGELDRSRTLAEQATGNPAQAPAAEHLLGLIDCRTGQLDSGIAHLRRASEADPSNPAFKVMLMRALVDAGRADEVLVLPIPDPGSDPRVLPLWHARAEAADAAGEAQIAEQAWGVVAAARPGDWRALSNLGNARAVQGRWSEAADALAQAAALNPSEFALRRNAGAALLEANRAAEALDHFAAVAAAEPNDAENWIALGNALAGLERYDDAIAAFESAKAAAGDSAAIELGLGRCLIGQKRYAAAEAALRRAVAIDPTDAAIVQQLGFVLDRSSQIEALGTLLEEAAANGVDGAKLGYLQAVLARRQGRVEEARELLLQSDPDEGSSEQVIAWYRLRAKIAEELGNAEEAFDAATAMNQARDQAMSRDQFAESQSKAQDYRSVLHELAATITPDWAARVPRMAEPAERRIAFLVGFPRSGTTLLDTFLMGHPNVRVLEEEQLVGKAAKVSGKIKDLPAISPDLLAKARETYCEALGERIDADFSGLVIDKYPLDMTMAPLIEAMFPGAPIMFAQRHPCDVVLSSFMQGFGIVNFADIAELADYYDAVMSVWTKSRDAMALNAHTVVYEELVADPAATLRPVIDFLGLDWRDELLDHQSTARARGGIVTPSYDQVTEPLSKAPSGRWKRYRKQLEPVLPVLLPWAERLGYSD